MEYCDINRDHIIIPSQLLLQYYLSPNTELWLQEKYLLLEDWHFDLSQISDLHYTFCP